MFFLGVVLESYGAGNIPTNRPDVLEVIKGAVDRGVIVVVITQCNTGAVSAIYETGKVCLLTFETNDTKLGYMLHFFKIRVSYIRNERSSYRF